MEPESYQSTKDCGGFIDADLIGDCSTTKLFYIQDNL
jgi:hypothetical protein